MTIINPFQITQCPFCKAILRSKISSLAFSPLVCCFDQKSNSHKLYIADTYARVMLLDDIFVYHLSNSSNIKTQILSYCNNKRSIEIQFKENIEFDYSDLDGARKKLNMILAFK